MGAKGRGEQNVAGVVVDFCVSEFVCRLVVRVVAECDRELSRTHRPLRPLFS